MPKYRLKNIPRDVFEDAVRFCDTHAQVPRHQMLQKLTILDFVIPLLPTGDESTILEIGAGLGIHAALLSHYGRVACTELRVPGSFIGADREIDTVRRELFEALGNGPIDFSFHDGRRLPYPDATFDIVFHNSVIEHVPDVVAFNREVRRVLKPGGLCICITGTPTLCWFRLVKHFVFRLPVLLAVVAAKEAIPRRWGTTVVNGVVRAMRLPQSLGRKLLDRLTRLDERLQSVAPTISAGAAAANIDVRSLYSRLYHFVYFPEYNRVVIEKAAADLGCTTDQLLSAAANHFKRSHRRMSFDLAPATHGQHYKGVWHEMREWRLERWQEQFAAADLRVEHIIGYRYHQLLEATPSDRLNSWLYYLAAPRIHEWIRDGSAPERASEIIITARRPA